MIIVVSFCTTKCMCGFSKSNSLNISIKGSNELPKIPRALKDKLIKLTS